MKTSGIIRRIDDLGRVVIPVEMRRVLDMGEREALSISLENNAIAPVIGHSAVAIPYQFLDTRWGIKRMLSAQIRGE